MPKLAQCPQCNRQLSIPEALLGKMVKCPDCGATFTAQASPGPAAVVAVVPEQGGYAVKPVSKVLYLGSIIGGTVLSMLLIVPLIIIAGEGRGRDREVVPFLMCPALLPGLSVLPAPFTGLSRSVIGPPLTAGGTLLKRNIEKPRERGLGVQPCSATRRERRAYYASRKPGEPG